MIRFAALLNDVSMSCCDEVLREHPFRRIEHWYVSFLRKSQENLLKILYVFEKLMLSICMVSISWKNKQRKFSIFSTRDEGCKRSLFEGVNMKYLQIVEDFLRVNTFLYEICDQIQFRNFAILDFEPKCGQEESFKDTKTTENMGRLYTSQSPFR